MKMKFLFSLLICTLIVKNVDAQSKVYNQFLEAVEDNNIGGYQGQLGVKLLQQMYKIQGTNVVELYEMGGDKWYGFVGDTSKFNVAKLPFFKKDGIKKLVKKHSLPIAVGIYQKEARVGMTKEELELAIGSPQSIKKVEENDLYIYPDDLTVTLKNEIVTLVTKPKK